MSGTPWVVSVMANIDPAEPRPHFACERCGERVAVDLPLRVMTFVEVGRGIIRAHRKCRPPRPTDSEPNPADTEGSEGGRGT